MLAVRNYRNCKFIRPVAERARSDPGPLPGVAGPPTATVVVPQNVKLLDTDRIYPGKTGLGLLHSPTQLFTRTSRSLQPTRKKRIPSIASLQPTRQQGIPSRSRVQTVLGFSRTRVSSVSPKCGRGLKARRRFGAGRAAGRRRAGSGHCRPFLCPFLS